MTTIKLELDSMGKSSKRTAAGIEQVTYNCKLAGSIGACQVGLTLKSSDIKELNTIVPQIMDKIVLIEIRDVNPDVK